MPRQEGAFLVEDFFLNDGGLNTADSPFLVQPNECTGGKNFDYVKRGGIQKRPGHDKLNDSANSALKTFGLGLWDKPGSAREVIRAADRKLQKFTISNATFTNLSEDTVSAGTDFLAVSNEVPVVSAMFNSPTAGILFLAGGGMSSIYGVYSASKVTKNGVPAPAGSISTSVGAGAGVWGAATGTYYYAVALYKASTGAISNAALDKSAVVANATDEVTITLSSLSAIDTTKYTKLYLYRSSVGGAADFTAGVLAKEINISAGVPSSVVDTGTVVLSSQIVPRAQSTVLDNSELPSGTFNTVAVFKQRLVTASGSTVYIGDTNKPESWPVANRFTVPSGGDVTALGVISVSSPMSAEIEEILCVLKQNELWVITGSSIDDWSLKYVGRYGCSGQPALVPAEGYLAWIGYKGPYIWNGTGKPKFIGKKIKDKFTVGGDIDKSKLSIAWGLYSERRNEISWCLSSKTLGENKYFLRLNLNVSQSEGSADLNGNQQIEGRFVPDVVSFPSYAGLAFFQSGVATEELIYIGDASGFLYSAFSATAEADADYTIEYLTPFLNFGRPSEAKKIHKIIAWVLDAGPMELQLSYWANYRFKPADSSELTLQASDSLQAAGSVWGSFLWGAAVWGANANRIKGLSFYPNSSKNNCEGDSILLKFSQTGDTETVVIYGFSVYYSNLPSRK